jgi:DNA helicase II / ATP-dependent DNA helicase PcrA
VRGADALLDALDPDQHWAATHPGGPLAVIAGAGTGKTRVLVARIAWLIAAGHARPQEICALTFMNDSAREIAERLRGSLGTEIAARITVGTSHRLANALLREHAARFGRPRRYSIWDPDQARRALTGALAQSEAPTLTGAAVRALAAAAAQRLHSPRQATVRMPEEERRAAWSGLAAFEAAKRASAAFDFDDLLLYAAVALESDTRMRARAGRRLRHVLLDEVQDTNHAQYRLVALLAAEHRNLVILGDPDQAICAYRGATSEENLDAFARDFPEHTTITLERNYRSTPTILRAANALIARNPDRVPKRLWTALPDGPTIAVEALDDELEEAQRIAAWARGHLDGGTPPAGLCVLVRVNDQTDAIEQALAAERVPVHAEAGVGFFARAEIRDALAVLTLVANPRDRLAFARATQAAGAGVGPAARHALFAHADAHPERPLLEHGARSEIAGLRPRQAQAVRDLCRALLAVTRDAERDPRPVGRHVADALVASGQPARLARLARSAKNPATRAKARRATGRLRDLVRLARAHEHESARPDLGDFLAALVLAARDATAREHAVSVLTIHRAKGLEFEHVWLAGLEEGLLPHARSVREGTEAEERRLAYVAVTRARRTLHASWARARGGREREPSRYLADLGLSGPSAPGTGAVRPASGSDRRAHARRDGRP